MGPTPKVVVVKAEAAENGEVVIVKAVIVKAVKAVVVEVIDDHVVDHFTCNK